MILKEGKIWRKSFVEGEVRGRCVEKIKCNALEVIWKEKLFKSTFFLHWGFIEIQCVARTHLLKMNIFGGFYKDVELIFTGSYFQIHVQMNTFWARTKKGQVNNEISVKNCNFNETWWHVRLHKKSEALFY